MQKIFITGGSGFIGKKLLSLILKKNKNIHLHAIFNNNKINIKSSKNFFKHKIDLTKKNLLRKKLEEINPCLIINLAGFKDPRKNDLYKKKSYEENFVINKHITDFCKKNNKTLIYTSTDLVYSDNAKEPNERQFLNPNTLHGINKLKSEQYIRKKIKKYTILRFATVYDENENNDSNFINASCEKIKNKKEVYAASNIYRSFISTKLLTYVMEKLVHLRIYGTYNIGEKPSSYYNKIKSICTKNKVSYRKYLYKTKINIIPKYRGLDLNKFHLLMKKIK